MKSPGRLLATVVMLMVMFALSSCGANVASEEGRITIYFLADYYSMDPESTVAEDMLADIGGLSDVNFEYLPLNKDAGIHKVMLSIAGKRGDIYVMPSWWLKTFVDEMVAVPLDGYIDSGVIDVTGKDLSSVKLFRRPTSEAYADQIDTSRHVYAFPTGNMFGLMKDFLFDNRSAVMIIPEHCADKETAAEVIQWLSERYSYDALPAFAQKYGEIIKSIENNYGVLERKLVVWE